MHYCNVLIKLNNLLILYSILNIYTIIMDLLLINSIQNLFINYLTYTNTQYFENTGKNYSQ